MFCHDGLMPAGADKEVYKLNKFLLPQVLALNKIHSAKSVVSCSFSKISVKKISLQIFVIKVT